MQETCNTTADFISHIRGEAQKVIVGQAEVMEGSQMSMLSVVARRARRSASRSDYMFGHPA